MQEVPLETREDSEHRIAIHDFNGNVRYIEADELVFCVPTKACVQFWATLIGAIIAIGIGVFFMIWRGESSVYFPIGSALLGTGLGVLMPSPDYKALKPAREEINHITQ